MSTPRTTLNVHFKKAWTFTDGCMLKVINPSTSASAAGLQNLGYVTAVNTSAKFKLSPEDPFTYVMKLTIVHGVDQQRIYALDPTLFMIDSKDANSELKEGFTRARDMAPTITATKRWSRWIGMLNTCFVMFHI